MKTFRVYVSNMSRNTEKSDLLKLFKRFGNIVDIKFHSDVARLVSLVSFYMTLDFLGQCLTMKEFDKAENAYDAVMKMDE